MAAIKTIDVTIQTGDVTNAGTDGDVYVGICGREFYLDTSADDFERSKKGEYRLGESANILNRNVNDPANPQLDTNDLDKFPVYIRFEPFGPSPDWNLSHVNVKVNGADYAKTSPGAIWLGQKSGKIRYLVSVNSQPITRFLNVLDYEAGVNVEFFINVLHSPYEAKADWNGTSGTDNRDAFHRAIRDAAQQGRALYVPAGKYLINPIQQDSPLIPTSDAEVLIFGDGADETLIKLGPGPNTTTGFFVNPGGKVKFQDLTLEGRSRSEVKEYIGDGIKTVFHYPFSVELTQGHLSVLKNDQDALPEVSLKNDDRRTGVNVTFTSPPGAGQKITMVPVFHHVFAQPGDGTVVKATRCRFTEATTPFKMDGQRYFLELVACNFDVFHFSVLAVEFNGGGGKVHFRGCIFKTGNHCMYINTGVSLLVDGCVFEQSGDNAYGAMTFGGTSSDVPEYVRIVGCVFKAGVAHQVLTSPKVRTSVSDCIFIGKLGFTSIQPEMGGVEISNCLFTGSPDSQIGDSASSLAEVVAVNCRFEGSPVNANVYRAKDSQALWRFTGCNFYNDNDNALNSAYCVVCASSGSLEFVGCKFERSPQGNTDSQYTRIEGGRFVMRGCYVIRERSIWITAAKNDVTAELWGNVFNSSGHGDGFMIQPLRFDGMSTIIVSVGGADNLFKGAAGRPAVLRDESRVKISLTPLQQGSAAVAFAQTIAIQHRPPLSRGARVFIT